MKRLILSDLHIGAPYFIKKETLIGLLLVPWDEIYINGDLRELKGFLSKLAIDKKNKDLFEILNSKKVIELWGNHDPISSIKAFTFILPNGKNVVLTHGSQFEKSIGIGLATKLNIIFYYIFRFELRRLFRKFKSYKKLEDAAKSFYKGKCDYLIMGHTHQPKQEEGYVNSGDWIEHTTWIEINDNEIKLQRGEE
jgi:predicted phosphodiesterase